MIEVQLGDMATWVSAVVALVSAIAAVKSSRSATKQQEAAAEQLKKHQEVLEKQHYLRLREWTDQHFGGVRAWAAEVCHAISEATHLASCSQDEWERKDVVLIKLSALIDTGRWYFPNHWAEDYGTHKEPAYRGVRQEILDCVVGAYDLLSKESLTVRDRKNFTAYQREFVSRIQEILDPRMRDKEIGRVLSEFEVADRLRNSPGA